MGTKSNVPALRKRLDWEAIERDYRTGKFTLRELEAKHRAGYADISRRAKREKWSKDLAEAVKQATAAALIQEITTQAATDAQQGTTDVVRAAAQANVLVILGHRTDIRTTRDLAVALLSELSLATRSADEIEGLFDKVSEDADENALRSARQRLRDHLSLHNRVGSILKLADTLGKLQGLERKAFSIGDTAPPNGGPDSFEARIADLVQ